MTATLDIPGVHGREIARLRRALEEISKAEGRFNRDPITFAQQTILEMRAIANVALRGASGLLLLVLLSCTPTPVVPPGPPPPVVVLPPPVVVDSPPPVPPRWQDSTLLVLAGPPGRAMVELIGQRPDSADVYLFDMDGRTFLIATIPGRVWFFPGTSGGFRVHEAADDAYQPIPPAKVLLTLTRHPE